MAKMLRYGRDRKTDVQMYGQRDFSLEILSQLTTFNIMYLLGLKKVALLAFRQYDVSEAMTDMEKLACQTKLLQV